MTISLLSWMGIVVCLAGSAMCSGLTLGFFSLSRIHLELLARQGNKAASTILQIRLDANFLLATLLWSNVAVNVLLTLLADEQMIGLLAFFSHCLGSPFLEKSFRKRIFQEMPLDWERNSLRWFISCKSSSIPWPNHRLSSSIAWSEKKGSPGLKSMSLIR